MNYGTPEFSSAVVSGPLFRHTNGHSLARTTAHIFDELDSLLGQRTGDAKFAGIEIEGDNPQTNWAWQGKQYAVIRLSRLASTNWGAAYHEMAHEAVHLLHLVPMSEVTMLEEGIACWYADNYFERIIRQKPNGPQREPYLSALEKVRSWVPRGLLEAVKSLRRQEGSMSRFTVNMLIESLPQMETADAEFLVKKAFPSHSGEA